MPFESLLNPGKGECTSVLKWQGITLKEFDFGIFEYFLISFYNASLVTFWIMKKNINLIQFSFIFCIVFCKGGRRFFQFVESFV